MSDENLAADEWGVVGDGGTTTTSPAVVERVGNVKLVFPPGSPIRAGGVLIERATPAAHDHQEELWPSSKLPSQAPQTLIPSEGTLAAEVRHKASSAATAAAAVAAMAAREAAASGRAAEQERHKAALEAMLSEALEATAAASPIDPRRFFVAAVARLAGVRMPVTASTMWSDAAVQCSDEMSIVSEPYVRASPAIPRLSLKKVRNDQNGPADEEHHYRTLKDAHVPTNAQLLRLKEDLMPLWSAALNATLQERPYCDSESGRRHLAAHVMYEAGYSWPRWNGMWGGQEDAWTQFATDNRHSDPMDLAARYLSQRELSRGWTSWADALQVHSNRERSARHSMRVWRRVGSQRAWRKWLETYRSLSSMNRGLKYALNREQAQGWLRWVKMASERRRWRENAARSVHRFINATLARGWATWVCAYSGRCQMREGLASSLRYWMHASLVRAWIALSGADKRAILAGQRATTHWHHSSQSRSWSLWLARHRRATSLKRALLHALNRALAQGWSAWVALAVNVRRARHIVARSLRHAMNANLSRGWGALEDIWRQSQVVSPCQRAALHWHRAGQGRAWSTWVQFVQQSIELRRVISHAINNAVVYSWRTWLRKTGEQHTLQQIGKRSFQYWFRSALVRGWSAFSGADSRDLVARQRAMQHWQNSALSRGWYALLDQYLQVAELRRGMRHAMNRALILGWATWMAKMHEWEQLRDAISRGLRSAVIGAWAMLRSAESSDGVSGLAQRAVRHWHLSGLARGWSSISRHQQSFARLRSAVAHGKNRALAHAWCAMNVARDESTRRAGSQGRALCFWESRVTKSCWLLWNDAAFRRRRNWILRESAAFRSLLRGFSHWKTSQIATGHGNGAPYASPDLPWVGDYSQVTDVASCMDFLESTWRRFTASVSHYIPLSPERPLERDSQFGADWASLLGRSASDWMALLESKLDQLDPTMGFAAGACCLFSLWLVLFAVPALFGGGPASMPPPPALPPAPPPSLPAPSYVRNEDLTILFLCEFVLLAGAFSLYTFLRDYDWRQHDCAHTLHRAWLWCSHHIPPALHYLAGAFTAAWGTLCHLAEAAENVLFDRERRAAVSSSHGAAETSTASSKDRTHAHEQIEDGADMLHTRSSILDATLYVASASEAAPYVPLDGISIAGSPPTAPPPDEGHNSQGMDLASRSHSDVPAPRSTAPVLTPPLPTPPSPILPQPAPPPPASTLPAPTPPAPPPSAPTAPARPPPTPPPPAPPPPAPPPPQSPPPRAVAPVNAVSVAPLPTPSVQAPMAVAVQPASDAAQLPQLPFRAANVTTAAPARCVPDLVSMPLHEELPEAPASSLAVPEAPTPYFSPTATEPRTKSTAPQTKAVRIWHVQGAPLHSPPSVPALQQQMHESPRASSGTPKRQQPRARAIDFLPGPTRPSTPGRGVKSPQVRESPVLPRTPLPVPDRRTPVRPHVVDINEHQPPSQPVAPKMRPQVRIPTMPPELQPYVAPLPVSLDERGPRLVSPKSPPRDHNPTRISKPSTPSSSSRVNTPSRTTLRRKDSPARAGSPSFMRSTANSRVSTATKHTKGAELFTRT